MKKRKIALLVDIDNVKIGKEAFNELYEKYVELLNKNNIIDKK